MDQKRFFQNDLKKQHFYQYANILYGQKFMFKNDLKIIRNFSGKVAISGTRPNNDFSSDLKIT